MDSLLIARIIVALLLIILIIPQGRGGGLGSTFGSTSYHTRKGIEKWIFNLTIILAITFVALSLATLIF